MKIIVTLFFAGALMGALCVGLVACNDEQSSPNNAEFPDSGIKPTLPLSAGEVGSESDKEVTAFFDENVYLITRAILDDNELSPSVDDTCVMINSAEDLPEVTDIYGLPLEFPDIDFDTYTLVIGQRFVGGSGASYYVLNQSMTIEPPYVNLSLIAKQREGPYPAVAIRTPLCYWGLYPKLSEKSTINVTVTYEN
jgi:hypothetical protein